MSRKSFFKEKDRKLPDSTSVDDGIAAAVYRCLLDPMIVIDSDGLVVEFNSAAEDLFGYSREQVKGELLADLIIPKEMREAHANGIKHFMMVGDVYQRIFANIKPSQEKVLCLQIGFSRWKVGFNLYSREYQMIFEGEKK